MTAPKTLEDWAPLPAERRLAEGVGSGLVVQIGDGTLPPETLPDDDPRILRTSFLRALILGQIKNHLPHEKGVQVRGAYLLGDGPEGAETRGLDLEGCDLSSNLSIFFCRLPDLLLLRSASLRNLNLGGSHLGAGLSADRLEAKGNVFLRRVEAQGEVRLLGAKLGADLNCTGASLTAEAGGKAFYADGLEVKGVLFLCGVVAHGTVQLIGARLGGNLDCKGARLTQGARGWALNCQQIQISGCIFLIDGARIDGVLNLSGAVIGHIVDEPDCWPRKSDLALDRCRYGAFVGTGTPVDAVSRIRWLSLQDESRWGADFWPQPWEECARVLREMGHGSAARDILIEKEKRQRAARRARVLRQDLNFGPVRAGILWLRDFILGITVRYGRMPLLAFAWLLGFAALGALIFGSALANDALKPNLPQVQRAPEWVLCGVPAGEAVAMAGGDTRAGLREQGESRIACFHRQPEGASHPRFDAVVYSLDTLIPVVSLEMQSYWIPDDGHPRGWWVRLYLWLHIALGWALTLLAVAGFSGLIRLDNTR